MTALPRPDPDSAKELFADALERSIDERAEFLAQACRDRPALRGEVELLLAAHERSERRFSEPVAPFEEQPGDRIGRFKLLQRIGEGGFGAVWMAEQEEPVRRKVALKVLKAGMDTAQVVARFEAERQALALMDHQNIARVFDGGATPQGRPYFAMELVRGVPITQYCDEAALSPRERLELFLPICQAVQHAHYKGVIHRDIKPSNVLVTLHDGVPVPKVIDFGIAKATQGRLTERTLFTEFRQMLGTPEYMAPEQAEMSGLDVDTRADVYSLGVLLYELLTGTRPFEFETLLAAGYAEMLRTIREVEPPKPSTRVSTLGDRMLDVAKHRRVHPRALGPLIRGDLDWIVMKSLEKDRSRRYTTASALADDLRRHLRSEPVEAGPPSKLYELRKYVVRHRLGVTAGAAIALSLVAGLAAAGWGWRRASDEAERANGEAGRARTAAARAEQVVALLEKLLGSADPHALKGPDYRVRQLLDDFDREFTDQLESEPEVEASLRATLAESFLGLGLAEPARAHAARAQALRLELFGAESPEHADSLLLESSALHVDGLYEDALAVCAQAVELLRALGPERSEPLAGALLQQGDLAWHLSRGEEAEAAFQEVIRSGGEGDESLVTTAMERLGVLYATQGRLTDAEMAFRQVLERRKGMERGESMELAGTCAALAGVLVPRGELDEALEYAQEAVRIARSAAGDTHPSVAHHMATLAGVWTTRGELERGAETLAEAAGIQRAVSGGASPALADILRSLARAETMLGRTDWSGAARRSHA